MRAFAVSFLLVIWLPVAALAAPASGVKPYRVVQHFKLGGPGGWDYLTLDPKGERLFISRGDRVLVMRTRDGSLVGTIADTPGVHGIALAPDLGEGFTSNGRADTVTVFDLASLATRRTIAVSGHNPDAILYDGHSHRLYTFNGRSHDVSVLDPSPGSVATTLAAGGKPEFAASNGKGLIFFNIEDTHQIGVIDSHGMKRSETWTLPRCEEPTGLALDAAHERLFSTCDNEVLAVTDARTGKHVAEVPIGKGPDAAAFDVERGLIFSSNGEDGTLSMIHEDDPDHYSVIATVTTQKSARTMALDPNSHRIYLVAAQFNPAPPAAAGQPRPRPTVIDGTFEVLVVGE